MTQTNKFDDINNRFMSLETGMIQSNKFRNRWRTLLLYQCQSYLAFAACRVESCCRGGRRRERGVSARRSAVHDSALPARRREQEGLGLSR